MAWRRGARPEKLTRRRASDKLLPVKRRSFLSRSGLAAAAAAAPFQSPAQIGSQPPMKITDIQTFLVGSTRGGQGGSATISGRNWVYVKVSTDQGIHGIGEAYSCGPDEATAKVVEDYSRWLVGQDPRNIQFLWDYMYNTTRFPGGSVVNSAISGIEHALWDIAGKAAGLPVWALLGGRVRDKVRLYQSIGGSTPQQAAENAVELRERFGYNACKMSPHNRGDNQMPYNEVTRTAGELRAIVEANPFTGAEANKLLVLFLADPPAPEHVEALDPNRSPGDEFAVVGREVFLHCPNGFARSKLTNSYFDSALSTTSTGRNWRTVGKLLDLADAAG